uniref:BTB domain-containing protein n=1 Tax=Panagrolaimus superbus TaxID=310955 RepID=A0A914Z048_9BILA
MAWKYWNKSDDDESMYDIGFSDSDPDEKGGPQSYVYKMQQQKFELFKLQNPENFDVKFEIEGKILYASKFDLIAVSQTMNSWLSDRWTTKDQSVIIETYTFDIFYQFLCFIYSGGCELTKENIFEIIDVAEFFDLQHLKDFCETFLMQKKSEIVNNENIFDMVDVAEKYSLTKFVKFLYCKIADGLDELFENESFLKVQKSYLLRLCQDTIDATPQEIFSASIVVMGFLKKSFENSVSKINSSIGIFGQIRFPAFLS